MDFNRISADLTVSPQIRAADVATIKAAGFRSIICNRPDGEGADQPVFAEIEAAATAEGMEIRYIPIVAGLVRDEDADAFGAALRDLPGPTLAYCRTGTRSAMLWSLSRSGLLSVDEVLDATKAAGYDLSALRDRIEAQGTPKVAAD